MNSLAPKMTAEIAFLNANESKQENRRINNLVGSRNSSRGAGGWSGAEAIGYSEETHRTFMLGQLKTFELNNRMISVFYCNIFFNNIS